nr:MAG TPA: hypothetical protein [Caudoviricetes sp.]
MTSRSARYTKSDRKSAGASNVIIRQKESK